MKKRKFLAILTAMSLFVAPVNALAEDTTPPADTTTPPADTTTPPTDGTTPPPTDGTTPPPTDGTTPPPTDGTTPPPTDGTTPPPTDGTTPPPANVCPPDWDDEDEDEDDGEDDGDDDTTTPPTDGTTPPTDGTTPPTDGTTPPADTTTPPTDGTTPPADTTTPPADTTSGNMMIKNDGKGGGKSEPSKGKDKAAEDAKKKAEEESKKKAEEAKKKAEEAKKKAEEAKKKAEEAKKKAAEAKKKAAEKLKKQKEYCGKKKGWSMKLQNMLKHLVELNKQVGNFQKKLAELTAWAKSNGSASDLDALKQIEEALKASDSVEEAKPEDLVVLAEVQDKLNKTGDSVATLEKALALAPKNTEVLQQLSQKQVKKGDTSVKVYVKGKKPAFDVVPVVKEGRTLVPLRATGESLNADVKWDAATQTITLTNTNGQVVTLQINNKTATVNGKQITLDVPATIEGGRTLVPLRALGEFFGLDVAWDANAKMAVLNDK